jgi:hypothetical protein
MIKLNAGKKGKSQCPSKKDKGKTIRDETSYLGIRAKG